MKKMQFKGSLLLAIAITLTQSISAQGEKDKVIDKILAQIGDQIILHSDVENQKLQALQQGSKSPEKDYCTILQNQMFQALLVNQAELDSIVIAEGRVSSEINRRIQYFASQIGSIEELEKFYGMSVEEIKDEFYTEIESRMMAQRMQENITSDISASPESVRKFYNQLPEDSIPYINSKVIYAEIVIEPKLNSTDKEKTRLELSEIRKSIVRGDKSFSSMAALYSEDPQTRKKGGKFPYVSRGTFVPEFDATAFSLDSGSVSKVFESSHGFHILQLLDRRGERYKGRHILMRPKVGDEAIEEAAAKADSILQLIKNDRYTFEKAASKFSDDGSTKNNGGKKFNPRTGSSKWDMSELDRKIFRVIDQLKEGDISGIEISRNKKGKRIFKIIKLLERTKPHVANLKEDYQYIQKAALNYKKQKKIDEWTEKQIRSAYIDIEEEFRSCSFEQNWLKVE